MLHALTLASIEGSEVAILAVGGGLVIAIISIVSGAFHRANVAKQREQSRREIAAYVAEGSMTVDDAAKLLADVDGPGCGWKKHA